MLMSSIAEWSVGAHLTVAQLVIATFWYIETDWSAPGDYPLALSITEWIQLRVATTAPIIWFRSVQVDMGGVDTCKCWKTWWSVLTLLVWSALGKRNDLLLWEICHVIHWNSIPGWWWLDDEGRGCHHSISNVLYLYLNCRSSSSALVIWDFEYYIFSFLFIL